MCVKLALGFKVEIRNWEYKLRCVITTTTTTTILTYSFNLLYQKKQEICMYDTIVFWNWNYVLCLSIESRTYIMYTPLPFPFPSLIPPPQHHHQSKFDANEPTSFFYIFKMHFCEIKQQKKKKKIFYSKELWNVLGSIGLPLISICVGLSAL